MAIRVDVNCDMGESLGPYRIGNDEEAVRHVTSANIACGFHASDPVEMARTVELCKRHGVRVGAHPGYPDIVGFGRRFMDVAEGELMDYVIYQVGALKGFLTIAGLPLQHVKLHGALYSYLAGKEDMFLRMVEVVRAAFGNVVFVTLGTRGAGELKKRCTREGVRLALEAFPDRGYTGEGQLVSRRDERAIIKDEARIAARAIEMVEHRGVESVEGDWIPMDVDTLCIHGDNGEGVGAARIIRVLAAEKGIEIAPLDTIV